MVRVPPSLETQSRLKTLHDSFDLSKQWKLGIEPGRVYDDSQ